MTRLALALLLPLVARAQLVLTTGNCNGSAIGSGSSYDFGPVEEGATTDVRFWVCNPSNTAVDLTTPTVAGVGFSITDAPAKYTNPPNNALPLQFTVHFVAGTPARYSANLQVKNISVILVAQSVPGPTLTVFPACTIDSTGAINFGSVANGTLRLCNMSLQNSNSQPLVISTLSATGGVFQGPQNLQTPFTLAGGQTVAFTLQVTPACKTTSLSGTLIVNTRSYPLFGSSFVPALPKPILSFDAPSLASGEQHRLTMNLAAPSPCGADGLVNLTFAPAPTAVADDPTIVFVAVNKRTVPFHVNAGSLQGLLSGQPSVVFATGSTAGTIAFNVNGDPAASLPVPPATIRIDSVTASNQRLGNLDIEVIGFDNTYSAGVLSFTFLDTSGNTIGPINADFTVQFKAYFTSQQSGSAFLMGVSFPVTGDQKQVSSVNVTLTNAAGQSRTGTLTFQ